MSLVDNKSCIHSKVGISLQDANGVLYPCCKFMDVHNNTNLPTIYNIDTLDNLHYRPEYLKIKNDIETNNKPVSCHRCWKLEDNNIQSRRQESNQKYQQTGIVDGYIQDMEIALDFTCNMMCRTCGPHSSSKWMAAKPVIDELRSLDIDDCDFINKNPIDFQKNFKRVMEKTNLSKSKNIKILGGEPFYSKNIDWFIDKLYNEVTDTDNFMLNIFTNGSVFPNELTLKKLLKFKNIIITASIDAVGDLASVIRWGVPWEVIENNCKKWSQLAVDYNNLTLSTCTTVSVLNVNRVTDVFEFGAKYNFFIGLNYLDTPEYLSVYMFPKDIRSRWVLSNNTKWEQQVNYHNMSLLSNMQEKNRFDEFLKSIKILDSYQNCSFEKVNKEIYDLSIELAKHV